MAKITRFEEIEAWQTARELTRLVYRQFLTTEAQRRREKNMKISVPQGGFALSPCLSVVRISCPNAGGDAGYLDQAQFNQLFELSDKRSRQLSRFMTYLENDHRVREDGIEYEV